MDMTATIDELRDLLDRTPADELPPLTRTLVCGTDAAALFEGPLTIAEVAERTGVTAHTLRYYERIGLVDVDRDSAGHRSYDQESVGRVIFIGRLRVSGLPIRDIQRYIALVADGESTVPARRQLLEEHRERVRRQVEELQFALAVVDYKITTYGGHCGD